jgi:DNA-binding beta-propeller fold protein YncE
MRRAIPALVLVLALTQAPLTIPAPASAGAPLSFSVVATRPVPAGAEIGAATTDGRFLAATGIEKVTVFDLREPATLPEVCTFTPPGGGEPTSVDIVPNGSLALAAVKRDPNPGVVAAFEVSTCAPLWQAPVGIGPDSIVVTPNGQQALVAVEDEEREIGLPTTTACPTGGPANSRPGRVDLLDLRPVHSSVPTVQAIPISLLGVSGVNCQDDPQPESLAVSGDSQLGYVTLQENNALATINLRTATVASVISLGTTTHLADVVNESGTEVDDPFTGRRESDGIALSHDGRWLFTADEGDTARPTGSATVFSGGRTMTVLSAARFEPGRGRPDASVTPPSIVADTGAQIEIAAAANGVLDQTRARNRGPEPEGIATFTVGGQEIAAVTLERSNAVILFDISDPRHPTTLALVPTGVSPEGVIYVASRRLLITTNEGVPDASPPVPASITVICVQVGGSDCR